MSDETYSFSTTKIRLDEIVSQVRKKDTSLEKSLDLLEEGVRLANACTELIDHADWTTGTEPGEEGDTEHPVNEQSASGDDAASEAAPQASVEPATGHE